MYIYIYIYFRNPFKTYLSVYVYIYIYIYTCVCVCVCVCVYVYTYIHTQICFDGFRNQDHSTQWRTQEFCSGEVQQIQLRTEDRENGDLGVVAP